MASRNSENADGGVIYIEPVRTNSVTLALVGTSPLICNRMAAKARQVLLYPAGRSNRAKHEATLKHEPLEEYRATVHTLPDGETLLAFIATAVKGAIMTAALDIPSTTKAQIGRLVYVNGDYVPVYGVPMMFMSVVRNSGMNRTPDIRTRAILPKWAAVCTITHTMPMITQTAVVNLLNAGGTIAGIGDWRPEKGKGAFGRFRVATIDDAEFQEIRRGGGREAQIAALEYPEMYDEDTASLWQWCGEEILRRGK